MDSAGSGSAIWRGPVEAVEEAPRDRGFRTRIAVWSLATVGLIALRMCLPFNSTDTMATHLRIVESLLQGQNWGRQALVGSAEFPTLPTLGLVVARLVGSMLRLRADHLLVAVAQVWSLCYFLRTAVLSGRAACTVLCLGLALWAPDVRDVFLASDPNWVTVVPAASVFYHTACWHRTRSLRDAVVCAMNCGVLAFAGWVGAAFAVAVLAMMCHDLRRFSIVAVSEQGGVKLLIWAPFCYCLFLWLLWNRLIMGDMFFGCRRLWLAAVAADVDGVASGVRESLRAQSFIIGGGILVLVLSLWSEAHGPATCLLAGLCVCVLTRSVLDALHVFSPGSTPLCLSVALMGLVTPVVVLEWRRHWWRLIVGLGVAAGVCAATGLRPAPACVEESAYMVPAPPAEAIASFIDRFWPGSRVLVYGVRAPAMYHDIEEKRFVGRLDFHAGLLLEQATDEQLHLLVPPCEGTFYPTEGTALSSIHRRGESWLLLEKQWQSGWQLWRCVVPPPQESKLRPFE